MKNQLKICINLILILNTKYLHPNTFGFEALHILNYFLILQQDKENIVKRISYSSSNEKPRTTVKVANIFLKHYLLITFQL